jgi:hypothetical protein
MLQVQGGPVAYVWSVLTERVPVAYVWFLLTDDVYL